MGSGSDDMLDVVVLVTLLLGEADLKLQRGPGLKRLIDEVEDLRPEVLAGRDGLGDRASFEEHTRTVDHRIGRQGAARGDMAGVAFEGLGFAVSAADCAAALGEESIGAP